jgi:hypothetical protein
MQSFSAHAVLSSLRYHRTRKKRLRYSFFELKADNIDKMPRLSYGINEVQDMKVATKLPDGQETTNTAKIGDVIMSGVSGEKYVIRREKFHNLYIGMIGKEVSPEQSPRMVARYDGNETITFKAVWGEDMILKKGDYVVQEKDGKNFYRIAKAEFEKTYERIP